MPYLRAYAREIEGTDTPDTPITWIASTEGVKADGHDLRADAWDLSRYGQYGPVLWAHDMWGERLPIGKGAAYIEGDRLMVDVSYDTADPFAMQVRSKARKGMVAGSVSWDTIAEGEDRRNQLLEFSMVPVPLDPASLPARQRSAMHDLAQRLLDATEMPTAEDGWPEIASQMVGLFRSVADDAKRLTEYRRLEREYKRFDKTPPEYMTTFELEPFTVSEIRGLFLEGEPKLLPEMFADPLHTHTLLMRLNTRQIDKLIQAANLIHEAIEGAQVEPVQGPDAEPPEEASILLDLNTLLADASTTITGVNDNE